MITYIKQIFSKVEYKIVAVIHMKSGKKYKIPCDEMDFAMGMNGLVSYKFTGTMQRTNRYMNMNEVEFIACEKYSRFGRY